MPDILLLNGPNLNLLGTREPEKYGHTRLAEICEKLQAQAQQAGFSLSCLQSNAEHELIQAIQDAPAREVKFALINPAAFTHTSVAIRDAFLAVALPFIEIHLSNIHARETFRSHSYFSDIAQGVIAGLGAQGYELALSAAIAALNNPSSTH
ncbi:MAG: type II 3-dehydroquinate dehydratase [gamma proteobacterium symbiont of Bathyaustriella thionipta]|nr:type II 3-dehydroquinate dehydratase [gamma proteobacterium symbiont of Bathyaustriella thionipta]